MTNRTLPDYSFSTLPADLYFTISGHKSISVLSTFYIQKHYLLFNHILVRFLQIQNPRHNSHPKHKCHSLQNQSLETFLNHTLKNVTASNQFKYLYQ